VAAVMGWAEKANFSNEQYKLRLLTRISRIPLTSCQERYNQNPIPTFLLSCFPYSNFQFPISNFPIPS